MRRYLSTGLLLVLLLAACRSETPPQASPLPATATAFEPTAEQVVTEAVSAPVTEAVSEATEALESPTETSDPTEETTSAETEAAVSDPTDAPTETVVQPTEAETAVEVAAAVTEAPVETAAVTEAAAAPLAINAQNGGVIWAWSGTGAGPGNFSAPGQIVLVGDGSTAPVLDLAAPLGRVNACGDEAVSPDQRAFAFYAGREEGTLYLARGTSAPVVLDTVSALTCLGYGSFRYAPNSARAAYIDHGISASPPVYADGFLNVVDIATGEELFSQEGVTAFDITDAGVAFISFFNNDQGQATEAAVSMWDGSRAREIATLRPQTGCQFTSAQVGIAPDVQMVAVLGHRCSTGETRTSWQFYTVDPETRSAVLADSDFQPGVFASFSRSNNLFFSPEGSIVYFTVPDGITAYTTAVAAVNRADMEITIPVERQAVFANLSGNRNATPVVSPDGNWLALVITTPNNENRLFVLNLADPAVAPIEITAGARGDVITNIAFTPNSAQVIYVAGAENQSNNSLFTLDLASASESRVARGRFAPGIAVSPDGTHVALLDWQLVEKPNEPLYANLITVDLASGDITTLAEGADIVDGEVTNQRFVYPLSWVAP